MRAAKAVAAVLATGLLVAACSSTKHRTQNTGQPSTPSTQGSSSSSSGAASYKKGGGLTIVNVQGQTWSCQFNPFNPANNQESLGFVYEPLVYVNLLQNQAETPMLATKYTWGPDKKSITFTIRDGVKWNDGQPFSAQDVAFTFNLMKRVSATDLYSLWTGAGLQSVTATGSQVTMQFDKPAEPYFWYFADLVGIVPQHIWSTGNAAVHPETFADPHPVGTGPYTVSPCSPNNIQYVANPYFWQTGKPYVQKVQYPGYLDNGPANLDLANGKGEWGSQFIPNIKGFYLNKSPDNHTWSPPVLNVTIFPNLDPSHAATSKLGVRQAISLALDRNQVSQIGEDGQEPPANQSGIVMPTFAKYYDANAVAAAGYDKQNIDKAKSALASAGYSTSNPLKLTIISITGFTDWDASLAVVKQQLKKVGIDLTVQDLAQQTFLSRLYNGDFDLAYYNQPSGGPTPYYELRNDLYSKNTAPIGKAASTNYERYRNPAVDALFDQYPTADDAGQVSIVKQIGAAMIKDVPVIPVTEAVDWFQYNTKDIAGWPTEQDQYAQPAAFNVPDVEQVLLHLYSLSAQ
jgi:peptide/nickel transport system substrate-binding protein